MMKDLLSVTLMIGLLTVMGACRKPSPDPTTTLQDAPRAQQTPLLDRALFFGNPEISGGQLSPDGAWVSFLKPHDGIMNIWLKPVAAPFDAAKPITQSARPLYGYFWSEDSKHLLYIKDDAGDENMHIFAVDPFSAPAQGAQVPDSRDLTPYPKARAQIYRVSQNNPDLLLIGLNDRDPAWHDLYALSISTGQRTLIYENKDRITSYIFDWDDTLRLLARTDERGTATLLRRDPDGKLHALIDTPVSERTSVLGWTADNTAAYVLTNRGELDHSTLFLMNPQSGELTFVEADEQQRVDLNGIFFDRVTRELLGTRYIDDRPRYNWRNAARAEQYRFLMERFPDREIDIQSATQDQSKLLVAVWGDRYAAELYLFDTKTRELVFQYTPRPDLKAVESHLAAMTPVRYPSSDNMEIPGYLTLPKGIEHKDLPLVVLVHGGPKGPRDYWGYDPEVQFLANRGYAVLQPNFRASGGYGKVFMNAGDLQWGLLMQDDITWGVKHVVSMGVIDPKRVAIMGGSYGGYATLAGLAFTPELYAAGVDIVGPSNLFTLIASIPPYWEAGRAFLYAMVGDPNTEAGQARMREASPLFAVDRINRPLLIVQGANDPRVKRAESDQIAQALHAKGKQVSYLLADDEGHGFYKPVNRMAMYAEIERFLASVLGGRYQEEMPADVADRLESLRVDLTELTPPSETSP